MSDTKIHSISQNTPVCIHVLFYRPGPPLYKTRYHRLRAWFAAQFMGGHCHANIRIPDAILDFGPCRGARIYTGKEMTEFCRSHKADLIISMLVHPTRYKHWEQQIQPEWEWSDILNFLWVHKLRRKIPHNCLSFVCHHLEGLGFREASRSKTLAELVKKLQEHPQFFMRIEDAKNTPGH